MNRLYLKSPCATDKAAVLAYRQEFLNSGDSIDGSGGLAWSSTFEEWLESVQDNAQKNTVRAGCVPTSVYLAFACDTNHLVGMISIRHERNAALEQFGGNIGYSVRYSQRGKGYAAEMLSLALEQCRKLGLSSILLTCHKSNVASARTMLKCGATLQDELQLGPYTIQRYWIAL